MEIVNSKFECMNSWRHYESIRQAIPEIDDTIREKNSHLEQTMYEAYWVSWSDP